MQPIRAASFAIAGAGLLFIPHVALPQTAVGFTPGSADVSDAGTLTYRIPIDVPPGRGGLEPKLALVYDSAAGNGYLGVGWGLEGFPTMQRCGVPRTIRCAVV